MDPKCNIVCIVGILIVTVFVVSSSSPVQDDLNQFLDGDRRTRIKRNASVEESNVTRNESSGPSGINLTTEQQTVAPTVCYNNATNNTDLSNYTFTCPRPGQTKEINKCCGPAFQQHCCARKNVSGVEKKDDAKDIDQMDIVTGISIAVGFVLCISACMCLYCCCCQSRPEIHDGIKLMWVRRSFGKELNRLEQPTYPNHLAVVSSRAGSRFGSRQGSRTGSRQGSLKASRNPSVNPSPSISRRASHDHHRTSIKASNSPRPNLRVEVPSSVVITVTTPSDEHGPTQPLLKAEESTDLKEI